MQTAELNTEYEHISWHLGTQAQHISWHLDTQAQHSRIHSWAKSHYGKCDLPYNIGREQSHLLDKGSCILCVQFMKLILTIFEWDKSHTEHLLGKWQACLDALINSA